MTPTHLPNPFPSSPRPTRAAPRRLLLLALLACIAFRAPLPAQPPPAGPPTGQRFVIGFLGEGSDFPNASVLMEELRERLLAEPRVREALDRAGFGPVVLSRGGGPRDMLQLMGERELHLVFATAVVYASHLRPLLLDTPGVSSYQPILQTQRRDDFELPGSSGVWRRGVVFAGPASALFHDDFSLRDDGARLAQELLAVPSDTSVSGYIYPRLMMERPELALPREFRFCGSDEEVVKHVVTGLLPIGACRQGELTSLLPNVDPDANPYYRILFKTNPFPTDPILLRDDLLPERSDLGRELKAALREIFNGGLRPIAGDLRVENASARDFEDLSRALARFESISKDVSSRPATPPLVETAPAEPTTPTPPADATPTPAAEPTPQPTPAPTPVLTPALPDLLLGLSGGEE